MTHPWRDDPRLKGRFHPQAPDDLQVLVHDGGPRLTDRSPELVWVTVTGGSDNVFVGRVLNQPQQLNSVQQGVSIKFVATTGEHLLKVTDKYLAERPHWIIQPCSQCGLNELFDAPSDLIRVIFPNIPADSSMGMFTTFCGVCGGVQVVQDVNVATTDLQAAEPKFKKWWQFWK
jgi:predicted nucleic-acid-binding Zn-ribbon protein